LLTIYKLVELETVVQFMKVDGYQVGKLYEKYATKSNQAATVKQDTPETEKTNKLPTEKTDKVEISATAADMNKAVSLGQKLTSTESTDDRQTRIDSIKKLIDAGQYNISSKVVAQSILVGANLDIRA
jgi:flagellar biosynthesis anti-sigma factor FlgM